MEPHVMSNPDETKTWRHRALATLSILCAALSIPAAFLNLLNALASGGCSLFFSGEAALVALVLAPSGLVSGAVTRTRLGKAGIVGNAVATSIGIASILVYAVTPVGYPNTNEPQAIGDLRTAVSAQNTWSSMLNGGLYEGRFECLSEPWLCVPDYPENAPIFLSADITRLGTKSGYIRTFHAGPRVDLATVDRAEVRSASSVRSYAILAVPAHELTGERSFCADWTGMLCSTGAGRAPLVVNGSCSECDPLE
jgi:hypothetical protein